MGADTTIRVATRDDLDWLVSRDDLIDRQEQARKIGEGEILVALTGGERVGLLRLDFIWSKQAYIAVVWVEEDHRRRGVGRAFLRFLDTHLTRLGCGTLLSSSEADEPGPQAWHRRMGFKECGFIAGINEGGVGEVFFLRKLGAPIP